MGGTDQEEQEEPLVALLSTAVELFRLLPSVLARGREMDPNMDPDVEWYITNSHRCLVLWLMLAENGVSPCPSVAAHALDSSLPKGS